MVSICFHACMFLPSLKCTFSLAAFEAKLLGQPNGLYSYGTCFEVLLGLY